MQVNVNVNNKKWRKKSQDKNARKLGHTRFKSRFNDSVY